MSAVKKRLPSVNFAACQPFGLAGGYIYTPLFFPLAKPMHGTILTLLKRYVQTWYDHSTWVKLVERAGFDKVELNHKTVYPDEHIDVLVGHATETTGLSAGELHEKLGEYLVPNLMYMYQKLLRPEWKTPDMLEHTGCTMHKHVRKQHIDNSLSVLDVARLGPDKLLINHVSPRRMGGLAVGIVRGLAAYHDEADRIDMVPATAENGERVRNHVRRL